MDIFDFDTKEDFEMTIADDNTKNFCIGLSGNFTESGEESLYNFFEKDLKINIISNEEHHDFNFNEGSGLETYISVDRRSYDASFILDSKFTSLFEAQTYIEMKLLDSGYIGKDFFSEITFLDADKIKLLLSMINKQENRQLELKKSIKNELESKVNELKSKYTNDPLALDIIKKIYIKV